MSVIRICMVVFSYYPRDARVRREAEALSEAGMYLDVICLRGDGESRNEEVNGVNIYRINIKRKRTSKLRYIWQWSYFIAAVFVKLCWLHLIKRYHIVHVHNMPDVLVASVLVPKLTGAKIILDLHDPMPEVYMTKYSMTASHLVIRVLRFLEKISIKFSDLVITPNISFRDLFISRSCPSRKIHIVMNSPKESIFNKNGFNHSKDKAVKRKGFTIMYHGYIVEHNGLDTAIDAIARVRKEIPNLLFRVYGDGRYLKQIQNQVNEMNLRDTVEFHGDVPIQSIAAAIASIDLGIVPNNMTPFTNLNFPTRIFECLIMNKPVIVPRTQGICDYFDDSSMFFFEAGDDRDLARQIIKVYSDRTIRKDIIDRGVNIWKQYRWNVQKKYLVKIVNQVLEKKSIK